jgi:hypothetical protein
VPTTIITGRDLVLTVATVSYDPQTTSAVLTPTMTTEAYQTLDGRVLKTIDTTWKFDIEMLADWGATSSLNEALWTAAESAPNTVLAVSLTAVTGAVWAFNILPVFPTVGGTAPDAQTISLSFDVVGTPVETFS